MSEYISRDAIHAKIEKEVERYFDDPAPADGYYLVEDVLSEIENFTAADVVPVRRARWFTRTYYRESTHAYDCVMRVCSACETEWSYDAETGVSDFYYCPHCGAKMENAGNIGAP